MAELKTSQAMLAAFRCPEEFCAFGVMPESSPVPGYFRFGHDLICYGTCRGMVSQDPANIAYDALADIGLNGREPVLPFDPDEVIQNLHLERYCKRSQGIQERALHAAYYLVRPLLPVWVRRHLQRIRLGGASKKPFPQWPVDSSVERLQERLMATALQARGLEQIPFIWFWPEGAPSCVIMTHDVETATGLEFCPTLMDMNDEFGIKSSFQLVPEERYPVTSQTVDSIRSRGFEVNVHDLNHDGHLYSDFKQFVSRADKINEYARRYNAGGFRSGALYRNLDWYDALEFSYDMSVPSVGHLEAQGGGACTTRPFFVNDMVELPVTTIQDYSLFHILGDYSIDVWKRQIETMIQGHGLISFIVHPDYVIEKRARDVYRQLLVYLAQLRADGKVWVALPGEVDTWWRQRNQLRLVNQGHRWCVTGPGESRAQIASAQLTDGKISYTTTNERALASLAQR